MCRLLLYKGTVPVTLADLLTRPSHSIIRQSYGCRERFGDGLSGLPPALNADGFGVAWYSHAHAHTCCHERSHAHTGEDAGVDAPVDDAATSCCSSTSSLTALRASAAGSKRPRACESTHTHTHAHAPTSSCHCCDASTRMPGVYTSVTPAWSDTNLTRLSSAISSPHILAHIRAASLGSAVHTANCHPFTVGPYAWMHNGHVARFASLRRRMLVHMSERALACVRGTTDSEMLFGVFLTEVEALAGWDALASTGKLRWLSPQEIQTCLLRTFALVDAWQRELRGDAAPSAEDSSILNVVVTDGHSVIASRLVLPLDSTQRAASLYFTSGSQWAPRAGDASCAADVAATGVEYTMMQADRREHAVIIASERLTACAEDWLPVPKNTLLVVHPSMAILRVPVTALPQLTEVTPAPKPLAATVPAVQVRSSNDGAAPRKHPRVAIFPEARSGGAVDETASEASTLSHETHTEPLSVTLDARASQRISSSIAASALPDAAFDSVWMHPWDMEVPAGGAASKRTALLMASGAREPGSPAMRPQMFCAGRSISTNVVQPAAACDGDASTGLQGAELVLQFGGVTAA